MASELTNEVINVRRIVNSEIYNERNLLTFIRIDNWKNMRVAKCHYSFKV